MGAHHPGCAVVRMGDLRAWCDCRGRDMTDDRDVLTPVYLMGFENGKESERAKIVAWLRQQWNEDEDWGEWFAERIEDGAHLK